MLCAGRYNIDAMTLLPLFLSIEPLLLAYWNMPCLHWQHWQLFLMSRHNEPRRDDSVFAFTASIFRPATVLQFLEDNLVYYCTVHADLSFGLIRDPYARANRSVHHALSIASMEGDSVSLRQRITAPAWKSSSRVCIDCCLSVCVPIILLRYLWSVTSPYCCHGSTCTCRLPITYIT